MALLEKSAADAAVFARSASREPKHMSDLTSAKKDRASDVPERRDALLKLEEQFVVAGMEVQSSKAEKATQAGELTTLNNTHDECDSTLKRIQDRYVEFSLEPRRLLAAEKVEAQKVSQEHAETL